MLVNRIWMHHFGRGIVATPGDFGILGERPTHPELLDYLASEFMQPLLAPSPRGGWQWKPMHRLIVTSTTYRQSSRRRPDLEAADPDNRLLGRASLRRLEAEAVRDGVLAVSGKLNPKAFGPPVPVAPDEVGQIIVAVDTRDSTRVHAGPRISLGGEEYRRSIYIQVRRACRLACSSHLTPRC